MDKKKATRLWPFMLTLAVIALDQLTKWIVLATVAPGPLGVSVVGDAVKIIHVYNPGIAFSIGWSLPDGIKAVLFGILPLAVIALVVVVYLRSDDLTSFQRWCVAGIIGGGLGNLLDRFFRPDGVLDFIDIKFYGLFGLERWPTFNVADSSVVVCGVLLLLSLLLSFRNAKGEEK